MTEKKMYEVLTEFANEHPLAQHIKAEITSHCKSFTPRDKDSPAYYDECNLLSSIVMGAENYLMWQRRKNERR